MLPKTTLLAALLLTACGPDALFIAGGEEPSEDFESISSALDAARMLEFLNPQERGNQAQHAEDEALPQGPEEDFLDGE